MTIIRKKVQYVKISCFKFSAREITNSKQNKFHLSILLCIVVSFFLSTTDPIGYPNLGNLRISPVMVLGCFFSF